MRNLFLILVLGNLGFAAWYVWVAERTVDVNLTRSSDLPGIALVGELEDSPRELTRSEIAVSPVEAVGDATDAEEAVVLLRCVSLGPFSELAQFYDAIEILRASGSDPTQRSEGGEVWLGHWVYLADVASEGQADRLSSILEENGIAETYYDPTGVDGDVLSLGLFREIDRAETIRDLALSLGFEPEMVNRTRPGIVYWADLTLGPGENPDLEPLQPAGRIIRQEQRACDSQTD